MTPVRSFEPVIGDQPTLVILGSMPGVISLTAVQYYANPRNAFWRIMADLFGIDYEADYAQRINQISRHPVVLWDTLKSCHRPGSLDAKIQTSTALANDFNGLLAQQPTIRAVAFNGSASEKYFQRLVMPILEPAQPLDFLPMPSTSPANAAMSFDAKLDKWRRLRDYID
ncbi:MAG: TDG/mug DNA glycosylase family protein [Planctomycetota bacterium]|jgi:TDG/mug DNA glycosylase family protein